MQSVQTVFRLSQRYQWQDIQILDDGRITDSQGRTVDFENTVIVMTSNIGAKALTKAGAKLGFEANDKKAEEDAGWHPQDR